MPQITRDLTILTNNLGSNVTLVLTFDNQNLKHSKKSGNVFPVIWKVGTFGGSGRYAFKVKYHSDYGFISGRKSGSSVMYTYTPINIGEKTVLNEAGNPPVQSWSMPSPIQPPPDGMIAENQAHEIVDIGFGLFDRCDRPPGQILFFEHVGSGSSVQVGQATPTLRGYITSDYKEGDILRTPIPFPVVFNENLAALEEDTYWKLELNKVTGNYEITRTP